MKNIVLCVSVLALCGLWASPHASAQAKPDPAYPPQPAMFVLKDSDSTLYLYGSQHAIKRGTKWRTPLFDKALGLADEIWLEATQVEMANPILQMMMNRSGYDLQNNLSSRLTPEEFELVEQAAYDVGLDMSDLNHLRPWAAANALNGVGSEKKMKESGKKRPVIHAGVEIMVETMVVGKPIKSIEDVEEHVMLFSTLPPEDEEELLLHTAREIHNQDDEEFARITKSWSSGDLEAIDKTVNSKLKKDTPGLYKYMMPIRNRIMADGIIREMKKSGTDMVIVGAAHISGPDSVLVLLKEAGYTPERIYDTRPPVATNTERMMTMPNYRTFQDTPPYLEISLRRDEKDPADSFILHMSYPLALSGCVEVSPIDSMVAKGDQSLDIHTNGYFVNIHPNPEKSGCGNESKAIQLSLPLKKSELQKMGALALNLQAFGNMDIYKLSFEGNTVSIKAPKKIKYYRPSSHGDLSIDLDAPATASSDPEKPVKKIPANKT